MINNTQAEKHSLLIAALKIVPKTGWSQDIIHKAATQAGLDHTYAELLFMGGVGELIDMYFAHIDELMMQEVSAHDISAMKVGEKIKLALKCRIKAMGPFKGVAAKTVSYMLLPWHTPMGIKLGWRTMDLIWYEVGGDKSTDFNYYTKRGILYTVYLATIKYWLSDHSQHHHETNEFIDRQIDNVLKFGGKFRKKSGAKS